MLVAVAALSLASYANSVSVTTVAKSTVSGTLTNFYFESAGATTTSTPSVDTSTSAPSGTGTTTISKGSTDYVWSPQFTTAKSIPAGVWVLTIYASGSKAGTMTAAILITNSAGAVQTTILAATSTATIGTTETVIVLTSNAAAATVPTNGYICVSLLAPNGSVASWTVDWGRAQLTSVEVPAAIASA